jgi:Pentapeptide repeats (8 copies)
MVLGLSAIVATLIAGYAAMKAGQAVEVAAKGIELQANEDRLSTAVSSVGGTQAAQRVAGFTLLRRHIQDRVTRAENAQDRRDAYNLYTGALDVLENYLRNPPVMSTETIQASPGPASGSPPVPRAGLGFGRPRVPPDNVYAANELRALMNMKPAILELQRSAEVQLPMPSVDLSNVQLYGQSWARIDFAWLGGHYFYGIDLRGSNLMGSNWEGSVLNGAHLQCANLSGAILKDVSLVGADLRGADLTGANLIGANLDQAKLDGVTGWDEVIGFPESTIDQPTPGISRVQGIQECLGYEPYWDMPRPAPGG